MELKSGYPVSRARACSSHKVLRNLFKTPYPRDRERMFRGGIDKRGPNNEFAAFSDRGSRKPGLDQDRRVHKMKGQVVHEIGHVQMSCVWTLAESIRSHWDVQVVTFAKQ
jgi:hypothetical protein